MFRIKKQENFKWPVRVQEPADGGKFIKRTFNAEFVSLEQSEINQVVAESGDLADRVLIGWDGVQDSDGNELAVTDENKALLLAVPYIRVAIMTAYNEAMSGGALRQKN